MGLHKPPDHFIHLLFLRYIPQTNLKSNLIEHCAYIQYSFWKDTLILCFFFCYSVVFSLLKLIEFQNLSFSAQWRFIREPSNLIRHFMFIYLTHPSIHYESRSKFYCHVLVEMHSLLLININIIVVVIVVFEYLVAGCFPALFTFPAFTFKKSL